MLPEIALTSQFMDRFAARFGCMPVEWHSALSSPERARAWRATASGEARVVVGARSALFLPYSELGLIVVDEEHDGGFKQEDRVHYQARDMAVVRASLGKFPVILSSATPSIESHVNARTGRYRSVVLPGRYSGAELPEVVTVDMRRDPPERGKWLAPALVAAMTETLGEEAASRCCSSTAAATRRSRLCRSCGHRFDCPQCTAWLVEHRYRNRLNCHHCGFSLPLPEKCPKCGDVDSLVACGPGVERIAEEVGERFPEARLALLSSDLVPSLTEMREIIKTIEAGEADIVIGTQMVAKGHHFPLLATVGVVDGDLGLGTADPRAAERTFQLLHQVTGRAGRVLTAGRGFVQTYMPEHPVMQAIITGDRDAFLDTEIRQRQAGVAAAVRPARRAGHLGPRQGAGRAVRPRCGASRAGGRPHRGAGPRRGADRRDPRPPPLAPAGQGPARARPAGLRARLARHAAQAALGSAADGRYRSVQFSLGVKLKQSGRRCRPCLVQAHLSR